MKTFLLYILTIFTLGQLIQVDIKNEITPKKLEIKAPPKIMAIFKRSCYDCHSNEVSIPWYSSIAPISWYIADHVKLGRKWLNFSIWENYTNKQKNDKLKGIFRTVYAAMPLPSYILLHKKSALKKQEIKLIRKWTGKAPF